MKCVLFQGSVTAMTVFFPLDSARLRLQGNARARPCVCTCTPLCVHVHAPVCARPCVCTWPVSQLKHLLLFLSPVDENRKAKSTPAVLADIIREEGL